MKYKTPLLGLKVLEKLYYKKSDHQGTTNSLINAYIQFGFHHKAIELIDKIPDSKTDVQSLKFKAWVEHKNGNIENERKIWDTILDNNYIPQIHNKIKNLILQSHREVKLLNSDIPLFSVIRNEKLKLPFFLKYYRSLGVTQFIFIDNNSNDGSLEFLLKQPDCHVLWTNDSYLESGHGIAWLNHIIPQYINPNQWYLVIDADEFFVYPECENKSLKDLIYYLDNHEYEGVYSFVIDTFPKDGIYNKLITDNDNLISISPFFINKYKFYHQIECPYIKPNGGIRGLLGVSSWLHVLPLMKYNSNIKLMSSRHYVTPLKIADITSTLIHLKFIGDFINTSKDEVKRKQHSGSGLSYRRYIDIFNNGKFADKLRNYNITKYQNSQQLVDLGLIKQSKEWQEFIENSHNGK